MAESVDEKTQLKPNQISRGRAKLALAIISVSNLLAWCCISLIAPFFPVEIAPQEMRNPEGSSPVYPFKTPHDEAAKKRTTEKIIGFIYSCPEIVIFLASLMSRTSPKIFYISGLYVFGTCNVLFGFLNKSPPGPPFIAICFAVRIVEGLGTSSILTASMAIASNNFQDNIGTVYGILGTITGIGFMLGPAVGGGLFELGGFGLPFWVLGGCVFLSGCVACAVLPSQNCVMESNRPSYTSLLRSPRVWFGLYCRATGVLSITIWQSIFAQHLQQFDLRQGIVGVIFIISAVAYSSTTATWGWLLDRYLTPIPLMIGGALSTAISLLLLGPAPFFLIKPMLGLTITALILTGFSVSPVLVSSIKCVVGGARELGFKDDLNTFGLVGGMVQSSQCLGSFLGPLVGGALSERFGFGWTMTFAAGLLVLPIIIFSPFLTMLAYRRCNSKFITLHGTYNIDKGTHELK